MKDEKSIRRTIDLFTEFRNKCNTTTPLTFGMMVGALTSALLWVLEDRNSHGRLGTAVDDAIQGCKDSLDALGARGGAN